jgi:hypothetical protein
MRTQLVAHALFIATRFEGNHQQQKRRPVSSTLTQLVAHALSVPRRDSSRRVFISLRLAAITVPTRLYKPYPTPSTPHQRPPPQTTSTPRPLCKPANPQPPATSYPAASQIPPHPGTTRETRTSTSKSLPATPKPPPPAARKRAALPQKQEVISAVCAPLTCWPKLRISNDL